jgi:hypothetical protein
MLQSGRRSAKSGYIFEEFNMGNIDPEAMAHAEAVLQQVRDSWLRRPGVTAVDLGFRWRDGEITDELALRVHVVRKRPWAELHEWERFPKEVAGIPVDVIEATYTPQHAPGVSLESAATGRGIRYDEVPLGVSIGTASSTAGTLGAKVIDRYTGDEMLLGNWHVLANRLDMQASLPVFQPGRLDGGSEQDTIAVLSRWVLGPYDAAVARLTGARPVRSQTVEGHNLLHAAAPRLGMFVWKSGRTTGRTAGFIDGVSMQVAIQYATAGQRTLRHVFRIVPRPGSGNAQVSDGGDSGAVWVDEATGRGVGLHFAGEEAGGPEFGLAHELPAVLQALNVQLPGEVAPPPQPLPPPWQQPGPLPGADGSVSIWRELLNLVESLWRRR